MRLVPILIAVALGGGCSAEQAEEFAFRKTMEYQLKAECGDGDDACILAVEEQIHACLAQSDWKRYVDNPDDQAEMQRFIQAFFPCFKDAAGNSIFHTG